MNALETQLFSISTSIAAPLLSIIASIIVAYITAVGAVRREQYYGRLRIIELCRRYLINIVNAFDMTDLKNSHIKNLPIDRDMYVNELETILKQLDEFVTNSYFGRLILEYPRISIVLVCIRRELIQQKPVIIAY